MNLIMAFVMPNHIENAVRATCIPTIAAVSPGDPTPRGFPCCCGVVGARLNARGSTDAG
jgi:hypothetical protein